MIVPANQTSIYWEVPFVMFHSWRVTRYKFGFYADINGGTVWQLIDNMMKLSFHRVKGIQPKFVNFEVNHVGISIWTWVKTFSYHILWNELSIVSYNLSFGYQVFEP